MDELVNRIISLLNSLDIDTGQLENYFQDLVLTSKTDNPSIYKVNEKIMLDALTKTLLKLDLDNQTDVERYRVLKEAFYIDSDIYSLYTVNKKDLPINFGKEMEQLYFDDNLLVGIHGTGMNEAIINEAVFTNGLLNNYGPKIDTTVALKGGTLSFSRFVLYVHKAQLTEKAIIVVIPKDDLSKKMWKQESGVSYLTPQYIYGYYISHIGAQFNESPEIIKNPNYGKEMDDYKIEDATLSEQCLQIK